MANLVTSDGRLKIFDNFQNQTYDSNSGWIAADGTATTGITFTSPTNWVVESNVNTITNKNKKSFLKRIKEFLFDPRKFFKNIKGSIKTNKKEELKKQSDNIDVIIEQAKMTGQEALAEQLNDQRVRIEKELKLLTYGYNLYITEDDVIKFSSLSHNNTIKIDWIKNYIRLIPTKVIKEMKKAIQNKLFDNFVVMHYDPEGKGRSDTKKEIEKKKDPILFGVIENCNRLYFIADWIDEYCNLTLDKLLNSLNIKESERKLTVNKIINDKVQIKVKKEENNDSKSKRSNSSPKRRSPRR